MHKTAQETAARGASGSVAQYLTLKKRAGLAPKIASIPRAHDGRLGGSRLCRFLMMQSFVCGDGPVGEHQCTPLAAEDLRLNISKQKFGCLLLVGYFAHRAQEVPGDLTNWPARVL